MARILFIWNISDKSGSIGTYAPSVKAAKQIGYEIDVVMNFKAVPNTVIERIQNDMNIKLIHIDIDRNVYSFGNKTAYKHLVSILENGEYDIVHCNTPIGGILGRLAAKKAKNRKVFYMNRGFHFYKGAPIKNWIIYYNIEKIFARWYTDAIATINPIDFKYVNKFKLRNNSKMKYSLPGPGVDLSKFKYDANKRENIRQKYGLKDDDIVIISVGELSIRKNFISIIEAMGVINSPRLFYLIVGDGNMEQTLRKRANDLHLENNVIFVGFNQNVSDFYSAADIFALPSLNEGFGRVGIEAMHIGLPLITSNVQGINLYSINNETGYKYDPLDVAGYAEGITKLMNSNELRDKFSEHNKVYSVNFAIEKTAEQISNIYQTLYGYK